MYTYLDIESHFEGKIKIAYLNQPESYNSLNKNSLRELKDFVEACNVDETVRCLSISGRGKAFCSGQNLKDALSLGNPEAVNVIESMVNDYYNPLVLAIAHSKKPVISLVNGPAVGAGAMLALICDLAFAVDTAYFSQAFSGIGLIPDTGGTYWLPKLLGRQQANYLTFTGKKISAQEAKTLGLIADVFNENDFTEGTLAVLETLANAPTKALSLTKKAFNASYSNSLEEQLLLEAKLQQEAAESEDFREGVAAFLEKRKPQYRGK